MPIYQNDVAEAKGQLWEQEQVIVTARQRNLGPGMSPINPTAILCTDKRIIIINRTTLGMRKDIESIPYDRVASVRLENGFISASIFLRVGGFTSPGGGEQGFMKKGEQEGEIPGLKKSDAKAVAEYVNRMISGGNLTVTSQTQQNKTATPKAKANQLFCSKCGNQNDAASKFCSSCGSPLAK